MTVHPFGATSSPACVNFALKAAANELEDKCGKEAADYVRDDFYADDGPKSLDGITETIDIVTKSTALCSERGFRLHKFVSSEKEVLKAVPQSERGKNVQSLDLRHDELPMERTLGIGWHVQSDIFQFSISLKDKPLTRRGILSTVSSIFDPLGLVAPVLLKGRLILQELCGQKADWDDPVPEDISMKWENWRSDLRNSHKQISQDAIKQGSLDQ
ncbi:uncharacterized protein LOC135484645 [Lineus longissimus]|uniref:uncharacterized protein LOC135484645 n=1 Tax=Lineus longissimus TaxID=88925 RepID=UPI00315C84C0